ncbi:MAG: bifunctional [glutamate--ammonia ligase]-adenylyl-L-tyrosine phosphorylase/[glutamate--ammonia-ligase] adenylyltransferase [Alphaproteobacteria bacterium]|nr:MAG: bifunctional [glutamate--ammonia ligase]-adenylyl-L-tyrosine phosphorylase/[glutamate--ammonia-ligase] adenylyltransferase [Alphaproteobacteria bacterium]
MAALCTFFPLITDKTRGTDKLADFVKSCQEQQVADIDRLINKNNHRSLLSAIFSNSPYLSRLLFRDVHFAAIMLSSPLDELYRKVVDGLINDLPAVNDISQLMRLLRQAKSQIALIISFADLSGEWPLEVITRRLTEFAEVSVSLTVSHLLRAEMIRGNLAVPDHLTADQLMATRELSMGTGYVVLAMGKMGGYELNYSSDIDLIILYDSDIVQYTGRNTAQDMFIKLTRKLVKIMQERTADGYVFRTDLRLRPDPGATAIALSMEGAEIYYQSMGLNWERAAMIKARPVAGDLDAGYEFLLRIKSFVWRKHLDYVALEDIYAIKKLIHRHHGHKEIRFAGQDIKLGHGGIREIEFYAQIFQLIAGGREPALQVAATCDALNALEKTGRLSLKDNQKLQSAYGYHRRLEHRLQMINDDQTHSMPQSADDLARITAFMGYQSQADFKKQLEVHLHDVHELFTGLLKASHQDEEEDDLLAFPADDYNSETLAAISHMGYEDPRAIYNIIQTWLLGRYRACRTERARSLLHGFIPEILSSFSRQGNPDTSFKKFDKFLSRLPSGIQLFSFIKAQPWLLELLSEIIGIAPNLADQLAKRPLLLDAVLNNDFFEASFTKEKLADHLEDQLKQAKDFQDILDISRKWASEHKFQIGVQILRNNIDAAKAGRNLSMVADVILEIMSERVAREFAKKHGEISGARFAVLALGKLGGQELTTTSDLDLVFIYDAEHSPPFSDGQKQLSINHYFARLSQQFINALTAMTGEGKLYDVDMRLRPSGNAGPIAVTLQGFEEYQTTKAWTWEHLALTRGRVVVGDSGICDKITGIIKQALSHAKRKNLLQDTADMRQKLRKEFGTTDIWSLKHMRGGLVDIEFICQYLILKHIMDQPKILVPNTLEQISQLKKYRFLSENKADQIYQACDFMQNLQVFLRLCLGSSSGFSEKSQRLIDSLCERFKVSSLDQLARKLIQSQENISVIYEDIIEQPSKPRK